MQRKIFSILTALALCLSLCPAWAFAAGPDGTAANPWPCGAEGDNVTAVLDGGTLTISGTGAMADMTGLTRSRGTIPAVPSPRWCWNAA